MSRGFYAPSADLGANRDGTKDEPQLVALSLRQMFTLLRPYVWPRASHENSLVSSSELAINRVLCTLTWVFAAGSKVCNVVAPLYVSGAVNKLGRGEPAIDAIIDLSAYCALLFAGAVMKELQTLTYLRVQKAAFVELAETAFAHLHEASATSPQCMDSSCFTAPPHPPPPAV